MTISPFSVDFDAISVKEWHSAQWCVQLRAISCDHDTCRDGCLSLPGLRCARPNWLHRWPRRRHTAVVAYGNHAVTSVVNGQCTS